MTPRRIQMLACLFWICAFTALPFWIRVDQPGWDVDIYQKAIATFSRGRDPYWDETRGAGDYKVDSDRERGKGASVSYVYSPLTLVIARKVHLIPGTKILYWATYAIAALAIVTVSSTFVEKSDPKLTPLIFPVALFFPGLLVDETILSGNIAVTLYGMALTAALVGWRRGRWLPFYLIVIVASCFKLPLLTLLAIPILSGATQWARASFAAMCGIAVFVFQFLLWQSLSRNQLTALSQIIDFNRDVGCSPAGLFAGFLFDRGLPSSPWALIFYLAYAMPIFLILLKLAHQYRKSWIAFEQWVPIMLIGVILLNPRILEYDVLPLTVPMALIWLRWAKRFTNPAVGFAIVSILFILLNALTIASSSTLLWKHIEAVCLLITFTFGCYGLSGSALAERSIEKRVIYASS